MGYSIPSSHDRCINNCAAWQHREWHIESGHDCLYRNIEDTLVIEGCNVISAIKVHLCNWATRASSHGQTQQDAQPHGRWQSWQVGVRDEGQGSDAKTHLED